MKKAVLVPLLLVLLHGFVDAQPVAPGGLTASTLSTTSIWLTWTDNSANETGFQIERSLNADAGFALVTTTTANATSYINTGLATGTPYFYRVRATNSGGGSGYTGVVSATTGIRRFLIDFGAPNLLTAATGWTNVTSLTTGFSTALPESSGTSSLVRLEIVKGPGGSYSTYGATQPVLDYPVSAVGDYHWAEQTGGTYRVTGLDNSKVYSLRIFGSRMQVSDSRKGLFIVNGGQQLILETTNNTSQTIVFTNVAPVAGVITLDFKVNPGSSFAHLNVLDIVESTLTPQPPTGLIATSPSSTQVNLTWTDGSTSETGFQIERSSTAGSGYGVIATTTANVTAYSDAGLTPATSYFYRVKAINAIGSSPYTGEASVTTLVTPPAAPTGLAALSSSPTQIDLAWTDNSTNETSFELERSSNSGSGFVVIATLAPNATDYSDASLTQNTAYFYRLKAVNAGGSSPYTEEATATTGIEVVTIPVAPAALSATAISSTQVNLSWTDASANETGFQVERSLTADSSFVLVATSAPNTPSYTDNDLGADTKYFYRVNAINSAGGSPYTAEVNVTTLVTPPSAPTNLTSVTVSTTLIDLTWVDDSDDEVGFQLERSLSSSSGFSLVTSLDSGTTAYRDTLLAAGTQYFYRLRAFNAGGASAYTAVANATTLSAPPAAPTTLNATASSSTQVNLTWVDASNNETGFQIERSMTTGIGYSVVTTTTVNVTSYSDAGLTVSTQYFYRIKAINAGSGSAYTAEVTTTTLAPAVTQPYGQIFNESGFASAARFPITGSGISRATNKLLLTGTPAMFSSYVLHDDAANPFRYTALENWTMRVRVKTPTTLNSSSLGIGIGVQSVNTFDPYSTVLRWSWQPGANAVYMYYKSTTANQIVSGTKYTPAANTYYWVEVTRAKDSFTYSIFDGTTGATQLFTVTLKFPTFTAGNSVKAHNTGRFCIHQFGGGDNEVTQWVVSTTALKNAEYIGVGDSNMHGMFASNNAQRWVENAMTTANKSFDILAGIADRASEVQLRLPEIIALSPKAVILSIGRNDIANSVSLSTVQSRIDNIINTLQNAGITVKLAGVIASNVNVSALQTYYSSKANVQVNAYAATKAASATTLNSSYNSGDGIHLNVAGNSVMSNLLFTILVPQTPPAAPSSLVASGSSTSQVNLTWTDNSNNETGFQIERSLTTGTGFTLVTTAAANSTSYSNTGLNASTQYFYRVRAVNAGGNSAYSPEASASTQAVPVTPPAAPTVLGASTTGSTQISLTWTDASNNETGFQLERSLTTGTGFAPVTTTGSNITSYSDNGLNPSTKYFYRLRATNTGGNSAYTSEVSATTTANDLQPVPPGGLIASTLSTAGILLNWTDYSSNETGFQIERSLTGTGTFTLVATTAANVKSYINTGLAAGTEYFYRIRGINGANGSDYTPTASATTGIRRFLIDLGATAQRTTSTGWNNATSLATGYSILLVESAGASTSLSLEIVKNPGGDISSSGMNQPVLDYPVSAVIDYHWAQGAGGTYRIKGLDNSKVYNLRLFGSRLGVSDSRKGLFTINGQQLILETSNNTSQTIIFTDVVPVSGAITMDFNVASGSSFAHLNVIDIVEQSGSAPGARFTSQGGPENTAGQDSEETGTPGQVVHSSLEFYPNPVNGKLTIVVNDPDQPRATIQIVDLVGKEVFNRDSETNAEKVFDVSTLSSGLYVIKVRAGNKAYSKLFVKLE